MKHRLAHISPEEWMLQIFSARAAAQGATVRRSTRDIDRIVGRTAFLKELNRRGFRAVENAGQTIIFCNQEPLRLIGAPNSVDGI